MLSLIKYQKHPMPKSIGFFVVTVLLFMETLSCLSLQYCPVKERRALLSFKHGVLDPSNRLSSWVGQDCCRWNGVGCDNHTGNVVKLDLRNPFPYDIDPADGTPMKDKTYERSCLEVNQVNSSLVELKHLTYLDLSWNNFTGIEIPNFFGSFQQLKYLNLSNSWFGGSVPHHLGNLLNLCSLDLNIFRTHIIFPDYPDLMVESFEWISNLFSLQHLDMSGLDITQVAAAHSFRLLTTLPSLLHLRLSNCGLDKIPLFPSLVSLDLSLNMFKGPIPRSIQDMTSLKFLDLSYNYLNSSGPCLHELKNLNNLETLDLTRNNFGGTFGKFPSPLWGNNLENLYISYNKLNGIFSNGLYQLKNLKILDLSFNLINGTILASFSEISNLKELDLSANPLYESIPKSLEKLPLEVLHLSHCSLTGQIPSSLGRLSELKQLDLSGNQLSGQIPMSLGRLSILKQLNLSGNQLSGPIPVTFGRLSKLESLSLFENHLNGSVPESLGQLSELVRLDLSYNSFKCVLTEMHFANLTKLNSLYLSKNSFSLKLASKWLPPFQLDYIDLRSCDVGPQFPGWLQTQTNIRYLIMSNASISDSLPNWLGNITIKLVALILSNNQINGSIPSSLCKIQGLQSLDLSKNQLSGYFPPCFGHIDYLSIIDLSSNNLSGTIPSSIGRLSILQLLRLSNNSFHGELPSSLRNCKYLFVLDLGENSLSGEFPTWTGENLLSLKILRLRSNKYNGSISPQLCHLKQLQILDVAHNNLSGNIPRCFGNINVMVSGRSNYFGLLINNDNFYSYNMMEVIKGQEREYTQNLDFLVNIDLSSNNLVGQIPKELTNLFALIGLNLSNNHFTGNIPKDIGQMRLLESLDFSINHLSGIIPQSISSLSSLSHLNVSYNNLSGQIPLGNQLQTLIDPSIYNGNNELCGWPLEKKCMGDEPPQSSPSVDPKEEERGDGFIGNWFYIGMASGFVVGNWMVCGVLLFKKTWRYAYFRFVDNTKNRLFMAAATRIIGLKKKFEM